MNWEYTILNFIQDNLHSPLMDKIMIFFTTLGNSGIIWVLIGAVLLISRKTRKIGVVVLLSLLFVEVFNNILLKNIIHRQRPFVGLNMQLLIPIPSGYSFPSGHTASSFAAAYVLTHYLKKPYGLLSYILASIIAFSRLYLYVHFPTDILGGILLGSLCGMLAVYCYNQIKAKRDSIVYKQKS